MMNNNTNLSVLHYYLYDKIYYGADRNRQIAAKDAKLIIGMQHNFPKPLRIFLLKELASNGLLEFINRDMIKVKSPPFDIIYNMRMAEEVCAQ